MLYAVVQCNMWDECPNKKCLYNFSDLPEDLLRKVTDVIQIVIGNESNTSLFCPFGPVCATAYLLEEPPEEDVKNLYIVSFRRVSRLKPI